MDNIADQVASQLARPSHKPSTMQAISQSPRKEGLSIYTNHNPKKVCKHCTCGRAQVTSMNRKDNMTSTPGQAPEGSKTSYRAATGLALAPKRA